MLLDRRTKRLDGAPAGGGGTPPAPEPDNKKKSAPVIAASESEAQYQVQLARFGGNHEMLARQLWGEQLTARRRNRELRDELQGYKTRNPDGSIVLVGEDVTNWNTYKTLGKPAEVKAKIENEAKLEGELANARKKEARAAAAKAHGFNAAVLSDRLDLAQFDLEMREVTEGTTKKQVAHVRKSGDDKAVWEPLNVVAERDWKEYLPALKASSGDSGQGNAGGSPSNAIEFPNNGAGGGGAGSIVDRFIANRDKAAAGRPNPLGATGTAKKTA